MTQPGGFAPPGCVIPGEVATKISLKQTGTYSGLSEELADVDTARLDPAMAAAVGQMVSDVRFFDLPGVVGDEVGADLPKNEITVVEGDREHTVAFVTFDESPQVAPLRRLADTLQQIRT